ncbi:MAG TPA: hypothetical protein VGS22_00310 [Thermoanaerobaculia bacterium]|jgi:hypothetical protein|nr:hypothetical protein [Thermoanaerobaculia bacterium]
MKSPLRIAFTALALLGAASIAEAKWVPVHSVWSDNSPLAVRDGATGVWSTPTLGYSSSNWQEGTSQAFSHAVALSDGHLYEFRLVTVSTSDNDQIGKLWDVYKDGVLACNDCVGKVYGLSGPIGAYFKIYVGTPFAYAELWHFSGYITNRFDY